MPTVAVGISEGVSASVKETYVGKPVRIMFTVRNNGFHSSPSFTLCVEGKTLDGQVSIGVTAEASSSSLAEGGTRQFSQSMEMTREGIIRFTAFCKVDNGRQGENIKALPPLGPRAHAFVDLRVLKA
jgi:hypothetical protein